MSYAELSDGEKIILSVECVGRGVPIPRAIRTALGPDLIAIIENPGAIHDPDQYRTYTIAGNGIHPSGSS